MRRAVPLLVLLAGCSLDPEAELEDADLRLVITGIAADADRLRVSVLEPSGADTVREPGPGGPELVLYFPNLTAGARTVTVEALRAGAPVQCHRAELAAGAREAAISLARAAATCPPLKPKDCTRPGRGAGRCADAGVQDEPSG